MWIPDHFSCLFLCQPLIVSRKLLLPQVMVIWILTACSDVVGYQLFGGTFCLLLHVTTQHQNQEDEVNLHGHENLKSHIAAASFMVMFSGMLCFRISSKTGSFDSL
jgi:hypothetical protein